MIDLQRHTKKGFVSSNVLTYKPLSFSDRWIRIHGPNWPIRSQFFSNLKNIFSAFIFSKEHISFKNSEKIHCSIFLCYGWPWIFSKFLDSMCVQENLKDFFCTHIDSTNSEKIYAYLRYKNKLLWIFWDVSKLICAWKKKCKRKNMFMRLEKELWPHFFCKPVLFVH